MDMIDSQPTDKFFDHAAVSPLPKDARDYRPDVPDRRASSNGCFEKAPLRSATSVSGLGPTLVVAPHPDDETLGCGGTIALLRRAGIPVHVLVLSDGAASHPGSKRFSRHRLSELRQTESLTALDRLGVLPSSVEFLKLPDGKLPICGDGRFSTAADRCAAVFAAVRPSTVIVPWRRDPHRDHRAAWEIATVAAVRTRCGARWLEYPVWLWDLAGDDDLPRDDEAVAWRLDIAPVLALKRYAIRAYRSQTTDLIDDDPNGFRLTASMLARFEKPWEVFFEDRSGGEP